MLKYLFSIVLGVVLLGASVADLAATSVTVTWPPVVAYVDNTPISPGVVSYNLYKGTTKLANTTAVRYTLALSAGDCLTVRAVANGIESDPSPQLCYLVKPKSTTLSFS